MISIVIDRFEGDIAVCEQSDRTMVNIPRNKLPINAKEGDVINIEGDSIEIDPVATTERRIQAQGSIRELWRKGKL